MPKVMTASNTTAPTQLLRGRTETFAYRRFGPDSGHGSLFQFHESFTRQAAAFLASDSPFAPY